MLYRGDILEKLSPTQVLANKSCQMCSQAFLRMMFCSLFFPNTTLSRVSHTTHMITFIRDSLFHIDWCDFCHVLNKELLSPVIVHTVAEHTSVLSEADVLGCTLQR